MNHTPDEIRSSDQNIVFVTIFRIASKIVIFNGIEQIRI